MKKRLLSILLTFVMVIGLLPTTAFAASASTIYVGGKALDPGEYITGDGVISTTKPEDNYAYLQSDANEDYILTLHNFDHTGEGTEGAVEDADTVTNVVADDDLTLLNAHFIYLIFGEGNGVVT